MNLILMTGPDPVMCIPASQNLNNDLVDECPMDEDPGWLLIKSFYHPLNSNCTWYHIQHHTSSTRLLQHQSVQGLLLLLFCGLHRDGTGLGETHGLHLVTAQPLLKMNFVGAASEGEWTWIYWKSHCSETKSSSNCASIPGTRQVLSAPFFLKCPIILSWQSMQRPWGHTLLVLYLLYRSYPFDTKFETSISNSM